ncbi:MAG TPA: hypothetical protein VHH73_07035 [Verrucomicrobiae bacterium]|nr:hypothetical protein [Verrucomicrobiae bacterium]
MQRRHMLALVTGALLAGAPVTLGQEAKVNVTADAKVEVTPEVPEVDADVGKLEDDMKAKEVHLRAAERALHATERAQRQKQLALDRANKSLAEIAQIDPPEPPEAPEAMAAWDIALDGLKETFNFGSPKMTVPIVVGPSALTAEAQTALQEDLAVMNRILAKSVDHGREKQDFAMGITVKGLLSNQRTQSIYLDGYGAIFMTSVRFPLVAPPAKDEEKTEKVADNEWERTKREIYGPRTTGGNFNQMVIFAGADGKSTRYDADKVEELKKDLLEGLKNAANVRQLKPDEYVAVVVTGGQSSFGTEHAIRFNKSVGRAGNPDEKPERFEKGERPERPERPEKPEKPEKAEKPVKLGKPDGRGNEDLQAMPAPGPKPSRVMIARDGNVRRGGRETTLTIRVKKSDAEAYSSGRINFEEFQKRAAVVAY